MKTYKNALENRAVAIYSENKSYYEIAVSRYYYSVYLIINKYLKDKLGNAYKAPPQGKDSHIFIIEQFLDYIEDKVEDDEYDILELIKELRVHRNNYEYKKNFSSLSDFKKIFKENYEDIEAILNEYIKEYKEEKERFKG